MTKTKTEATTAPFASFGTMQAEGFERFSLLGAAFVESMGQLNKEFVRFVGERLQEDVKTQHALMQCRDVGKLSEIQADFIKTAFDQYAAETGTMVEMSMKIVEESLANKKEN